MNLEFAFVEKCSTQSQQRSLVTTKQVQYGVQVEGMRWTLAVEVQAQVQVVSVVCK